MEQYETIVYEKRDRVATITLNRPEKKNALNPLMGGELFLVCDEVANDENIGAIILTGAGDTFCAGGDVKEDIAPLSGMESDQFDQYLGAASVLFSKFINIEKPTIAAINGRALGVGLDLAMGCDIRIASESAMFGEFFVKMGLIPDIGTFLMPRLIGLGRAKLLCFTGDLIDAKEAERIGLVEKVVPPDILMQEANELARRLAYGPTKVIGLIKKSINDSLGMGLEDSLEESSKLQYQASRTKDHKETVKSFLKEKKHKF